MQDIHVFDFDGSVTSQTTLMKRFSNRIKVSDMTKHRQKARLWSSPERFEQIASEMSIKPGFSFIGSGDYHHFSLALIRQIKSRITVVLFDNHPDWMKPPHLYHCGTWVYSLARLEQVQRIIIVGLESGDIEDNEFEKGDVDSYTKGKVVLLPYRPVELKVAGSEIKSLSSQLAVDTRLGVQEILNAIPTKDVYISLDKDCLRKEDAYTNWEQGTLPLATVLECIKSIQKNFNVIGADTVGDYSPLRFFSPLKWIGSLLDRPAHTFSLLNKPRLTARNEFANIALLELFSPMLKPWILLAIALILDTLGTVSFKHGTNQFEPSEHHSWKGNLENIRKALGQKQIAFGLLAYALEYVVWVAYISTTPLNVAFSLSSLNIILVLIASRFLLGEQVTKRRYIGALFILAGVFLVGGTA